MCIELLLCLLLLRRVPLQLCSRMCARYVPPTLQIFKVPWLSDLIWYIQACQ